jgi:arginine deiminase
MARTSIPLIEEMNKKGYLVFEAIDILNGKINPTENSKNMITIEDSELYRVGGGCRCATLPIKKCSQIYGTFTHNP